MINNVYMVALKGAYIQPEATIQGIEESPGSILTGSRRQRQVLRKKLCRPAGIWQFTGDGETSDSGQYPGTEIIQLSKYVCINNLTEFWPEEGRRGMRHVIISPPYFVATPIKVPTATMGYSFGGIFKDPPPAPGYIKNAGNLITTMENARYLDDFEIIVYSFVDGNIASTKFNWMCQVEVGLLGE